MLDELPFIPYRLPARDRLLLIPFCHHQRHWADTCDKAQSIRSFLGAEIVHFEQCTVLTGFMGYPHMLTLLSGIQDWRNKQLFFLGTAGSLKNEALPDVVTAASVIMTSQLCPAFNAEALDMIPITRYPSRSVITVDIPHRETLEWQNSTIKLGFDRVEMELYPLRQFYGRPFQALLVGSDHVGESVNAAKISYAALVKKFTEAFTCLMECIHE